MYLGIVVEEAEIRGAFFRQKEIVQTAPVAMPSTYEEFLAMLAWLVQEAARGGEAIRRVGVSVPGICTERRVTWVQAPAYLAGRDVADDLRTRLGTSVILANAAQLALLGEVWRGVARDRQSAALLSVGSRLEGALMLGGKIVHGAHGSAGALGWLHLERGQPPDPDRGYLDWRASERALEAEGRKLDPPLSSYEVVARAREGHPVCLKMVADFAGLLGQAYASMAALFDPEILIFADGLSAAFDLFAPTLRDALRRYGAPSVRETPIVAAQLGTEATLYGALRAAMLFQSMWA
jgi:predicted NBD/HSP70 family sugar kinase